VKQPGFSLLELLIAVVIIGLMAAAPRLLVKKPGSDWTSINEELNNLLSYARHEAILKNKVHRLSIKTSSIEVEEEFFDAEAHKTRFKAITSPYTDSRYSLPKNVQCTSLKLGKKNLFDEDEPYIYIATSGLVQEVELGFERADKEKTSRTFAAQPFLGIFTQKKEE
jgi:prepilin-type N-terminal cleavage/methylation domain-containing protein